MEEHHANLRQDRCDVRRCWRNRCRQRGSSRSLVWLLFSSVLPSSLWLLPLLSPSLLRLLPVLPSLLAPLAPLVLARSFLTLHRCSDERQLSVIRFSCCAQTAKPSALHEPGGFAFVPIGCRVGTRHRWVSNRYGSDPPSVRPE